MVSIHDRTPEIDERMISGHWEGDLIKGAHNRSTVETLVECTILFTVLSKIDNASAEAASSGFSHVLDRIEVQTRQSSPADLPWAFLVPGRRMHLSRSGSGYLSKWIAPAENNNEDYGGEALRQGGS